MSYSKENTELAASILSDRRNNAQRIREERHSSVIAKVPNITEYERQLSNTGLATIKALAMGENAEKYIRELSQVNLHIQDLIKSELVRNGYPEDYLDIPYTCKKCEDTGYVGGYSCTCRKELLTQLAVQDLERVSPAAKCRFDNFTTDYYSDVPDTRYGISPKEKMTDIYEYCKCYAEDFGPHSSSLYMSGATGLGKTHLSLAIANVAVRKGYKVIYGSAQNLLSELEKEKFSYSDSNEISEGMVNCDLLIIDDLGSEFSTQFTVASLYNLINSRINLSKPTIISTNLTEEELEKKYTQRVTSRIIGGFTPLLFMGRDIRQIKNLME